MSRSHGKPVEKQRKKAKRFIKLTKIISTGRIVNLKKRRSKAHRRKKGRFLGYCSHCYGMIMDEDILTQGSQIIPKYLCPNCCYILERERVKTTQQLFGSWYLVEEIKTIAFLVLASDKEQAKERCHNRQPFVNQTMSSLMYKPKHISKRTARELCGQ